MSPSGTDILPGAPQAALCSLLRTRAVRRTRTLNGPQVGHPSGGASESVRPRHVTPGATARGSAITRYLFRRAGGQPPRHGPHIRERCRTAQPVAEPDRPTSAPGRTLRERHHRSDGRTCRGDRCRARHGRFRACLRCRLPAAPRYRPRGHGAGRAAAGRNRPRHQGHGAYAQEPADRGHQGGAGRRWRHPSGDAPAKAESAEKPKRRATSRTRTGDTAEKAEKKTEAKDEQAPADKAAAQQQIEIPGQPSPKASAAEQAEQAAEGAPSAAAVAPPPTRAPRPRRSRPRRRPRPSPTPRASSRTSRATASPTRRAARAAAATAVSVAVTVTAATVVTAVTVATAVTRATTSSRTRAAAVSRTSRAAGAARTTGTTTTEAAAVAVAAATATAVAAVAATTCRSRRSTRTTS